MMLYSNVLLTTLFISLTHFSLSNGTFLEDLLDYTLDNYRVRNNAFTTGFSRRYHWNETHLRLLLGLDVFEQGISDYTIQEAILTPDLELKINITLEDAKVTGSYSSKGIYYKIVPLNGGGPLKLEFKDFQIYLNTQILPQNGTIQLLHFDMNYTFQDIVVSIGGLTDDPNVASIIEAFIRQFVPNAMKKKKDLLIPFVKNYIMNRGNEILKNVTLRTGIELMKFLFIY